MNQSKNDIVYFVKESPTNEELIYSLRSVEENWPYHSVWFCGGCPVNLQPDRALRIRQIGLNKWEKVRYSIKRVCSNDKISEDFWLFNDDFFILKPHSEPTPTYNGHLREYIDRIVKTHGNSYSQYALLLEQTIKALADVGCDTLNYEVHKPMLINRQKGLEILEKFPNVPGFRSLYGNYFRIGGVDEQDMKIKDMEYKNKQMVEEEWDFASTTDKSFRDGEIGKYIRGKFTERSRFERN